jgi:hypothetical protein
MAAMAGSDAKLQSLKDHRLYPFPNFQKDETQYRLCQDYWRALFHAVVGGDNDWPGGFYGPDLEREGNPIFSAADHASQRQTVVAQFLREDSARFFPTAYVSRAGGHQFDYDYSYLALGVIADISAESEALCRDFWRWFFIKGTSEAELEQRIRRHESRRP